MPCHSRRRKNLCHSKVGLCHFKWVSKSGFWWVFRVCSGASTGFVKGPLRGLFRVYMLARLPVLGVLLVT